MTQKEKNTQIEALRRLPDDQIDTSDIPEVDLTKGEWVRGKFYRPIKKAISVRLDADVLAWLQSQGRGYQSRINTILRQQMLSGASSNGAPISPRAPGDLKR